MGKDVIDDRYARLYEIPRQLARLGHDVMVECIGYQGQGDGEWTHEAGAGRLRFRSHGVRKPWLPTALALPARLLRLARVFRADLVIGASDIPHVVLAAWLARRLATPLVVDLYDNFEAFGQARIPGMVSALRRATRRASLVTTTSDALARYVRADYGVRGNVIGMPSTIDRGRFHPQNRVDARDALGLPRDALLIGTAGGLHRAKGIGELYEAWRILQADPRIHLVLAGPTDGSISTPTGDRVHYLGQLAHDRVATFFSALDVATICVLDTPFGRYCFPQKAYEILASGTPVVASDVGAMSEVLADYPTLLYTPGDALALAERIRLQLERPVHVEIAIPDWETLISQIEPHIRALVPNG